MGCNPSKQPWRPHRSEAAGKSSARVTNVPGGLGMLLCSLPDGFTWDGLVGPCTKDLFDRVTIDGEFLPARPICLCGLHIYKGFLVNRYNLWGKHKYSVAAIPFQSCPHLDGEWGCLLQANMATMPQCHPHGPRSPAAGPDFGIGRHSPVSSPRRGSDKPAFLMWNFFPVLKVLLTHCHKSRLMRVTALLGFMPWPVF